MDRFEKVIAAIMVLGIILSVSLVGTIVWVIAHFLSKVW